MSYIFIYYRATNEHFIHPSCCPKHVLWPPLVAEELGASGSVQDLAGRGCSHSELPTWNSEMPGFAYECVAPGKSTLTSRALQSFGLAG